MPARSKVKQQKFNPKSPMAIALFVVAFGVVGMLVLTLTKAATANSSQQVYTVMTDYTTARANNPSVKVVKESVSYTAAGADESVVQIANGEQVDLTARKGGGTATPVRTCYYLRAVDAPASVVITSGTNRNTVNLTGGYYYQKKCLQFASSGTYPKFSVKNVSGTPVNVYQQVLELAE